MVARYRKVATIDLRPVYTSLGLKRTAFKGGQQKRFKMFDVALNADASQPDSVWLFKGADYIKYNLRQNKIEAGHKAIAGNFGGGTWPIMFTSGIDAAVWGGPAFPNYWYMFKDDQYIRLNSANGGNWVVDTGPGPRVNDWWSASGTWFANSVDLALHGLGSAEHAKLHLFYGGQYMRHNLLNGHSDVGPLPIADVWKLPEPFTNGIEFGFYGTGSEEEHAFFFSDDQVAQYDVVGNELIRVWTVEERFPAFAEFMARPQLFLVEDYSLETYFGPPSMGNLVDTKSVPPDVTITTLMVTETVDATSSQRRRSVLDSQDGETVKHFNEQMDNRTDEFRGSEAYRYQMNADFHGDASANSLWGGEVNAQLGVRGSTDSHRDNLAESAFKTISSQVTEATRQLSQRTYDSAEQIEHRERVVKQESTTLKNPTSDVRVFRFYQQLQPTYVLLVLKNVRVAYGDGSGAGLATAKLPALGLLEEKLHPESREQVLAFLRGELTAIQDHEGTVRSVLADVELLHLDNNPQAAFQLQLPDGTTQDIVTRGLLIKASKEWPAATDTIVCVLE